MLKKMLFFSYLCAIFCWGIYHTYGITPFLKKSYTFEAWWGATTIHCNGQATDAMIHILKTIMQDYGSLSNQFVLKKQDGRILSCTTGAKTQEDTRFRFASLTKPITAALFLEHEAQGQVHRTMLMSQALGISSSTDLRINTITLHQLLTHTSGFDRLRSQDPLMQEGGKSWCPYNLSKLSTIRLDHNPGEIYSYDNRNYCLLAVALEKATNKKYEQLLSEYLFKYNFENIRLLEGPFLKDEARYDFRHEEHYFPSYTKKFDFYAMRPVAGLSGSAFDYARLIHFFLYQRNLPFLEIIAQNQDTKGRLITITAALRQKKMKTGESVFYHTGALPAARSLLMIRENGDIIVWLGSGVPADPNLGTEDLMEVILSNIN
ncbi:MULTISPECIES: serine hydrolase [unclassified Acinetobacter]|uniref:serine hydrolase domain-containing protein n=1 Tax=unclassified Acinetobacter TaxID=196816 RepID=UPI0015D2D56E|nr:MULTISPECIES: serine hydrolase domain-containing protein [unclassified Acinetobacter]